MSELNFIDFEHDGYIATGGTIPTSNMALTIQPPTTVREKNSAGSHTFRWSFIGGIAPFTVSVKKDNVEQTVSPVSTNRSFSSAIPVPSVNFSTATITGTVTDSLGTVLTLPTISLLNGTFSETTPVAADLNVYAPRGTTKTTNFLGLIATGVPRTINFSTLVIYPNVVDPRYASQPGQTSIAGEFLYDLSASDGTLSTTAISGGSLVETQLKYYAYDSSGFKSNVGNLYVRTYETALALIAENPLLPGRVPVGSVFSLGASFDRPSTISVETSTNQSTWTTESGSTVVNAGQLIYTSTASLSKDNYYWRVKATSGSETASNVPRIMDVEPARNTGSPTSSNFASSQHITFFDGPTGQTTAGARIKIPSETTNKSLGFWALQVNFEDSSGNSVGGAHIGLQIYSSHPNNHAVNWGGYNQFGAELSGTGSDLPSATSNPNTRDFDWIAGHKYELSVYQVPLDSPGTYGGQPLAGMWGGLVHDISTNNYQVIRFLQVPGAVKLANKITLFSEQFVACDNESRVGEWSRPFLGSAPQWRPTSGYLTYQSYAEGGCTNTNTEVAPDASAWVMKTNTPRTNHFGTFLKAHSAQIY